MLIRHKIFIAFGTIGALVGATGVIAISINEGIRFDLAQIGRASLEKPALVERAMEALQDWRSRAEKATGGDDRAKSAEALASFGQRVAACRNASRQSLEFIEKEGIPAEIAQAREEVQLIGALEEKLARFAGPARGGRGSEMDDAVSDALMRSLKNYQAAVGRQAENELAEIEAALGHADSVILWSSLALLLVGGGVALFAARTLIHPVGLLTRAVKQIGSGRSDSAISFRSRDEFGILIEGFNGMLTQIQARDAALRTAHDQLEKRVEERTQQLQSEMAERARVAAALKATLTQFAAIWENAPLSIMLFEPNDPLVPAKIVDCNPRACEMHGYSREELIGQSVDLIEAKPWAKNLPNWIDTFREVTRFEGMGQHRRKDGTIFEIEYFTSLIVVDGRQLVIGMDRDASARKKAEDALELMHRQLMDSSRQAGMAEVATGVLHNVGNVLNSVNVSATLVADQVRRSKAVNLAKVCTLLDQHQTDLPAFLATDPKGKIIPAYLSTLSENLATERQAVVAELDNLRKNIEHIKEIVSMQQSYAKTSGINETVSVPDMVEDALRINAGSLSRHDVDIARDYVDRPVATLDKHKVIQILINLIRNAKYACDESGRTDKLITVRTLADERRVRIAITDNGVGIPPENLTRIFSHGFTTRAEGHGFGLHSGALAAKELGGELIARSQGLGHGATFTLELPYKPETPADAKP